LRGVRRDRRAVHRSPPRGDVTIEDHAEHVVTHRMIDRYERGPRNDELRAAWKDDDIVVLRMRPSSVVRILV
jgi:hypothetical protein